MNGISTVSTAYLNDEKSFGVATIECPKHMFEVFCDLIQAYADTTERDLCRASFIRWYLLQDLRVENGSFWVPSLVASSRVNGDPHRVYTMPPFPLIAPRQVREMIELEPTVFPCPLPASTQSSSSCSELDKQLQSMSNFSASVPVDDCDDESDYDEAFYAQFGIEYEAPYLLQDLRVENGSFCVPSPVIFSQSNGDPHRIYTMPQFPLITPTLVRETIELEPTVCHCPLPALPQSSSSCSEFDKQFMSDFSASVPVDDCDDESDYDEAFYAQFGIEYEALSSRSELDKQLQSMSNFSASVPVDDCDDESGDYDEAFYAQFGIEYEAPVIPEHLKNSPDLFWYLCDNHDYDSSVSAVFN
eukprot:CAMPEP_0202726036 /NCGR_PEP_ID=MMETSP1385-20130828/184407_1 /ASSEMBLY_ACC=CAM_ASM_000861 /TAXON_ID=933848 /ORGANISM="Elphidium margaritaceum" /LENGTH=358 /DNA_ID=CAMNT_0049392249 /DNA_START=67 /DNA_END=1144 /DNA_ORIENTATION=+